MDIRTSVFPKTRYVNQYKYCCKDFEKTYFDEIYVNDKSFNKEVPCFREGLKKLKSHLAEIRP